MENNSIPAACFLLKNGANSNIKNKNGKSFMDLARKSKSYEIVKLIDYS
jgi:ankyrin repeat protein